MGILIVFMEPTKMAKKDGLVAGKRTLNVEQLLRLEMVIFMNKMFTIIHLKAKNKSLKIFTGVRFEDSPYAYLNGAGRQGSTLLKDDQGFTFSHKWSGKIGQETWTCSRKSAFKCRAAVKIRDGFIYAQNEHNHPPYRILE